MRLSTQGNLVRNENLARGRALDFHFITRHGGRWSMCFLARGRALTFVFTQGYGDVLDVCFRPRMVCLGERSSEGM